MAATPITVCTVTFEADLRLTILQLLSFARLARLDQIEKFIVVLNGADNDQLRSELESLHQTLGTAFVGKLEYRTFEEVVDGPRVGYYDQQAVKLALSGIVTTEYYLMLDAKNHLVAPLDFSIFFYDSKPIMHLHPVSDYWKPYVEGSIDAVDGDRSLDWSVTSNSITPFVFSVAHAKRLVEFLTKKYTRELTNALVDARGTEFILYYSYVKQMGLEGDYYFSEMPNRTLFTIWPQDPKIVRDYIQALGDTVPMFGLHRNRLPQLTDSEQAAIGEVWYRQLLYPWEDPAWFMENQL